MGSPGKKYIEDNIGIAPVGCHQEAPDIVAGDVACDDMHRREDVAHPHISQLLWHIVHVGVNMVDGRMIVAVAAVGCVGCLPWQT